MTIEYNDPYAVATHHGYTYTGDQNVQCGGVFYCTADLMEPSQDFISCVVVEDLEGATGAEGAYWVRQTSVWIGSDQKRTALALECSGLVDLTKPAGALTLAYDHAPTVPLSFEESRLRLADAIQAYLGFDDPEATCVVQGADNLDALADHDHLECDVFLPYNRNFLKYIAKEWL